MKRVVLGLTLAGFTSVATANCLPIFGTVKLNPIGSCATVASLYSNYDPTVDFVGPCFSVDLKLGGILPATGFAGITNEGVSPKPILQGDFKRTLLTARSTFTLGRTRFYASEIITETVDTTIQDPVAQITEAVVTEQSVILGTNGRGIFRNARGYFNVLGNSIGESARVTGEICTP